MNYDESQQIVLGLVLAAMMFGVALELKLAHFKFVLRKPLPVMIGLVCQCLLLPWLTLLVTLFLDLRPGLELGMMLVACCPGGNLSNIITHLARGNTALSVSVTSVSSLLAIITLPLNFALISSLNPRPGNAFSVIGSEQYIQHEVIIKIAKIRARIRIRYSVTCNN